MPLWMFHIEDGAGTRIDATLLAEAPDEPSAATIAATLLREHPGIIPSRPGTTMPSEVEGRWWEILGGDFKSFPVIVSNKGRDALYAWGKKNET